MNKSKSSEGKGIKDYIKEFDFDGKHFILTIRSETKPKNIWLNIGQPLPYKPKTFKQELKDCFRYFKPNL